MKYFFISVFFLLFPGFFSCMPQKPPVFYPGRTTVTETKDYIVVRIKTVQKPDYYNFINVAIFYSMSDSIGFSSDNTERKNENDYIILTFRKPERGIKNTNINILLVNMKSITPEAYGTIIN